MKVRVSTSIYFFIYLHQDHQRRMQFNKKHELYYLLLHFLICLQT